MKINGLNGVNLQSSGTGMMQSNDSVSKNLQNQIANAQKELQELSANKEMSIEEKMKKRQEIQQQINALNQQLRQHQIEQRKEKQQKKDSTMNDMLGENKKASFNPGKQNAGLSQASMKALISADSAMAQAKVQGNVATKMNGRAGVLDAEIKLDMARGNDVEAKKEELAEVQQKAISAETAQLNTLSDANTELEEAAKTEQQTGKTEEKDKNIIGTEEKSDVNIEVNKELRLENNSTELLEAIETSSLESTTYKHVDVYL